MASPVSSNRRTKYRPIDRWYFGPRFRVCTSHWSLNLSNLFIPKDWLMTNLTLTDVIAGFWIEMLAVWGFGGTCTACWANNAPYWITDLSSMYKKLWNVQASYRTRSPTRPLMSVRYPCTVCSRPTTTWCGRCRKVWYCSAQHLESVCRIPNVTIYWYPELTPLAIRIGHVTSMNAL